MTRPQLFIFTAVLLPACAALAPRAGAESPLSAGDLVKLAVEANPQVRAAKAQHEAAAHQIRQAYAPQDPQLSWQGGSLQSGLSHPLVETVGVSESFQFPGKSWLQGGQARRSAEIARLVYLGALRDAKAQALTAYYQALLDAELAETAAESAGLLARVLKVTQVAYAANQITQSDVISAEFGLAQASQTFHAEKVAEANDEAALNQLLGRDPLSPLELAKGLELRPLSASMEALVDKALSARQEVLEAALSEANSETALRLARMELLPDFSVSLARNHYLVASAAPAPGVDHDKTLALGVNVPIFFWLKQKEDMLGAQRLLDASRANLRAAQLQAKTSIVELYRSTALAYETAVLYRDSLIPLARRNFQVALIAYQSRKADFPALSGALQSVYQARISYLSAANQYLAGRVALEQAIGEPTDL